MNKTVSLHEKNTWKWPLLGTFHSWFHFCVVLNDFTPAGWDDVSETFLWPLLGTFHSWFHVCVVLNDFTPAGWDDVSETFLPVGYTSHIPQWGTTDTENKIPGEAYPELSVECMIPPEVTLCSQHNIKIWELTNQLMNHSGDSTLTFGTRKDYTTLCCSIF